MWNVVESILDKVFSFRMLTCAPHEHLSHPLSCSALVSYTFCFSTLFSWSFRNLVSSLLNPSIPLLLQSLGKPWCCVACFPSCLLCFAFIHSAPLVQISAVTNPHICVGSLPAVCRTVAAITQRLREDSFAFSSFVNSALISSHSFRSQTSRGKVFLWFRQHRAETFQ